MYRARISSISGKIAIILFVICCCGLSAQAKYGGGSGTADDPYLIYDANQMNAIGADSNDWDKQFRLMADIDLSGFTGISFNIIGYYVNSSDNKPFIGVFDGNGHTISNFTYDSNGVNYIGLFGYVGGYNAEIRNLGLIDPNVNAGTGSYVGVLVGYVLNGTMTKCYVEGGSVKGKNVVGGLVGYNEVGTIINSYSNCNVSGENTVGGLVGGYEGTITNCYSTGSVTGNSRVGGLVGSKGPSGRAWASFWDIETSGQATSNDGTGLTTVEMQTATTFTRWWGCEPIWTIDEGVDYPRLVWENKPGEIITIPPRLYGGGSGEPDDPYLIYTAEQLNTISLVPCHHSKHFKLITDIDLSSYTGISFHIIGNEDNPYTGVFDGNGHTISNFNYTSKDKSYTGIFGYVGGYNAKIRNLRLIAPNINAGTGEKIGSLVGRLVDGTISGCYVEGGSVSGSSRVGGLVGSNDYGTIANCYSTSNASGDRSIGGLVGNIWHGTITNCYSAGGVAGGYSVGGLIGWNNGTITNCYSVGSVTGYRYVGGLVGRNRDYGTITNSYSTGSVSGSYYVGGLVGRNYAKVISSFWDIETSGKSTSDGGMGLPTAEMQTMSTFTDAGWDFVGEYANGPSDIWAVPESGGYPILWWQLSPLPLLPTFSGGSGTTDDPYLISTTADLNCIGHNSRLMVAHFKLIKDIDLTGVDFPTIGTQAIAFRGVFDGNGFEILNFKSPASLFGVVHGDNAVIKDLGLINPNVNTGTGNYVSSLVGRLEYGTITNCYVEGGSVAGNNHVGGLVGSNSKGTILDSYTTVALSGHWAVGGLVGYSRYGMISKCHTTGLVIGIDEVGGLVGANNNGIITNCYSSVLVDGGLGGYEIGGLVGGNWEYSTIYASYATGSVIGGQLVGGLVGNNSRSEVNNSFWDIETSGRLYSAGGTGLPTAEMQMHITFTDAGWDFTSPVWTIDEGIDYPRLWWEFVPVLHAEPDITLGTNNSISWEPVIGDVEYYAECAADKNFTNIVYNSGWITKTSFEFAGLELGKRYWYSVKARNADDVESQWSNVESSLQCSLSGAVEILLNPESLKNKNMKTALLNKIEEALQMIDEGLYKEAMNKLQNDIIQKTDGCAESGQPDKGDWIITCEQQNQIYPLVIETIEHLKGLMK